MTGINFNATTVAPNVGFVAAPKGRYTVIAQSADIEPTKDGSGKIIKWNFVGQGGNSHGRTIQLNTTWENQNPKAVELGHGQLSAICHAVGVMVPQDLRQLLNIPFILEIDITPDGKYNQIIAIEPIAGQQPQQQGPPPVAANPYAQPQQQPQAYPQGAPQTMQPAGPAPYQQPQQQPAYQPPAQQPQQAPYYDPNAAQGQPAPQQPQYQQPAPQPQYGPPAGQPQQPQYQAPQGQPQYGPPAGAPQQQPQGYGPPQVMPDPNAPVENPQWVQNQMAAQAAGAPGYQPPMGNG